MVVLFGSGSVGGHHHHPVTILWGDGPPPSVPKPVHGFIYVDRHILNVYETRRKKGNSMRKYLIAVAAVAVLLLAIPLMSSAGADGGPAYIQASTSFDQYGGGTVAFDTVDGSNKVSLADDAFTVEEAGLYLIVAAPQVGGIQNSNTKGSANFWIAVDGTDVPNSNVTWQSAQGSDGDVIVSQGVGVLAEGAVVTVEWSTTGPALEAIVTEGEPLTPSIIFTLVQVG